MKAFFLIFGIFLLGAIFDAISAPFPGFYLLPALLVIFIFFGLPFVFDFLNFMSALIIACAAMLILGWLEGFHYGTTYIFHLSIYFALFLLIFYFTYGAPAEGRN